MKTDLRDFTPQDMAQAVAAVVDRCKSFDGRFADATVTVSANEAKRLSEVADFLFLAHGLRETIRAGILGNKLYKGR